MLCNHEFFDIIHYGISDEDKQLLIDMLAVFKKIDSWWVYNIEADWDEIKEPEKVKQEECYSGTIMMINVIIDILFNGKSEEYKKVYLEIKEEVEKQSNKTK